MLERMLSRAVERGVAGSLRRLVAASEHAWQVDPNHSGDRSR